MTARSVRAVLDQLPDVPAVAVIETPAGIALAVVGDQSAVVEVHTLLSAALPADQLPIGYALISELADAVSEKVLRGDLALVVPSSQSTALIDVSPRRVPGLGWIRVVRSPLGEHTRGSVNAYIVDTGDGVVLVDAGFSTEASRLETALTIGNIRHGDVRAVFVTHCHADHVGAAGTIQSHGWIGSGPGLALHSETDRLGREMFLGSGERFQAQLVENGIATSEIAEWRRGLELMGELADWPSGALLVADNSQFTIGEVTFTIVHTPGHSPDHIAIRASHRRYGDVIFLGDMTLGSQMPQCGVRDWESIDPIADMRRSWLRLLSGPVAVGLPGHGALVPELGEFQARFEAKYGEELETFQRRYGGREITAAEVVDERTRSGDGFGPKQFVFYGAIAWLKHLEQLGLARLIGEHPKRYYVEVL